MTIQSKVLLTISFVVLSQQFLVGDSSLTVLQQLPSQKKDTNFLTYTIQPVQIADLPEVKRMLATVINEIWDLKTTVDSLLNHADAKKLFYDEDNFESLYLNSSVSTYLKIVVNGKIVGTGAVKKFNDDACEIKRVFILKEYRGQGWGKNMSDMLRAFAINQGYKKSRIEIMYPQRQPQAVSLAKKRGYYEIQPYRHKYTPGTIFMERDLTQQVV